MRAVYWVIPGLLAGLAGPREAPWNLEELWAVLAGYLVRYRGFSPDEAVRLVRQVNPRAMTAPGFERAWSNGLGEYILTDDPNFDPNIGSNLNREVMERRGP